MVFDEQAILNQLAAGILLLDLNHRIVFTNEWIIKIAAVPHTELEGHSYRKIFNNLPADCLNQPVQSSFRCELIAKNQKIIPVFITISSVHLSDIKYSCVCILQDPDFRTEKKSALSATTEPSHFHGLYGKTPRMQELYEFIEMAAETDTNVVIQGESGTGKELVASAIHNASNRRNKPFVKVNCAALTETLLESELFGHARGAFTGAYRDHEGKFEFAHEGTIFLDEIGEISLSMQAKLLRVLQERVVTRVGDNREIPVDVRVIVATNKNLRALVSKDKFREDLFYRLNVFPLHIPSLRERSTDIPLLIDHFIDKFMNRTGKQIETCSPDVLRILMSYCWPGNVRELENIIEHSFILSRTKEIQVIDLPHELRVSAVREGICAERIAGIVQTIQTAPVHLHKESNRLSITKEALELELQRHGNNKTATARALGISKVALWKKMKKFGMN